MLAAARTGGAPTELLGAAAPTDGPGGLTPFGCGFFIRMLFSALVDADFLDTEGHFDRGRQDARGGWPALPDLLPLLDAHVDALGARAAMDHPGPVTAARRDVLDACRARAASAPGLFTLTVPTGGGKTLASLAFALHHARAHNGLRRVIYVIPYTSIIEQTADVFRNVFAPLGEVLVEHHSNLAPTRETTRSRMAAENWDAPLIVTTNVQFFESLFAAAPGRCRKLHNIAGSVVILDEAQLLPPAFLRPTLLALDELMARYRVSVVLSTATQPALLDRGAEFRGLTATPRELAPEPERLRSTLRRVRVERLHDLRAPVAWEELAGLLAAEPRVLCVVDRRDAARDLHALMPSGTFHLSALMCPQHRADRLATIRARLAEPGTVVRVVATQLVEAGVDVDFPVVFRAAAGLDSVAQAAGRCNREGRLAEGRMVLFKAPQPPPPGVLRTAHGIALPTLEAGGSELPTLAEFDLFFRKLYWSKALDASELVTGKKLLAPDRLDYKFRTAADCFRLIPDDQVSVIVPYGRGMELADEIARDRITRERGRAAQRVSVGVPRRAVPSLLHDGAIEELSPGLNLYRLAQERLYAAGPGGGDTGLDLRLSGVLAAEELIVSAA